MFQALKICLLSLALSLCCGLAGAADLVRERAVFEDVSGRMSLDQVKGAAFKVLEGDVVGEGFRRSALWLRLRVDVPASAPPLVLSVRPSLLDTAVLYLPKADGPGVIDLSQRSAQAHTPFELPAGPQILYLRVQSAGFLIMAIQVEGSADEMAGNLVDHFKTGAIVAIYASLLIGALGYIVIYRSSVVGFLFLNLFSSLLLYLAQFDFAGELFTAAWFAGNSAARCLTIINFMCVCLLTQSVLGFVGRRRLQLLVRALAAAFALLALAFFYADPFEVLRISAFLGALSLLAIFGGLSFLLLRQAPPWRKLQVPHLIVGLTVLAFDFVLLSAMLQILRLAPVNALLLNGLAFRGFFLPLTMFCVFWYVSRRSEVYAEGQRLARAQAEVQYTETKKRLDQQSEFIAMLVHEFKTPLYTIQLAATSLSSRLGVRDEESRRFNNILRAADDLNFIIERCAQVDQIEQGQLPLSPALINLDTLLHETRSLHGSERLAFSGPKGLKVVTDYQYLRIIVLNLVTNALKYSPPAAPVQVDLEPLTRGGKSMVLLKVSNALGPAGAPDPARVFSRYYRGEGAKQYVGTGLGLWLSQALASKLGSQLVCEVEGQAISFCMNLELS
ncbi:MAG: 7TM-DISM domain-containing protein [Betaproteobacteria bacterium]